MNKDGDTYLRMLNYLDKKYESAEADGTDTENVIRRKAWPQDKGVMFIVNHGKRYPRIIKVRRIQDTGGGTPVKVPTPLEETFQYEDLSAEDWEFVSAKDYFGVS